MKPHLEIFVSNRKGRKGHFIVELWNEKTQKTINHQVCRSEKSKDLFVEFLKENWNLK